MEDKLEYLRQKTKTLPLEPGVYLMKDKQRKIIYIGKAKSLKNRVSSYFRSIEKHEPKVYKMVIMVDDFDYIVTSSEFEALVLECSLIKQHAPKYNILLKDDKGYSYIKIFPKQWSRITAEMQKQDDGGIYLGPYTSSYVAKSTVEEANKVFMLPTCNRKFPQEFGKGRPCLNYHIKQCMAPCTGKISEESYNETIEQATRFIKGGGKEFIGYLHTQMEQYSEKMEFEKAAQCRDRIRAIEKLNDRQNVIFIKNSEQDVIALAKSADNCCAVVLKFRNNRLHDKDFYLLGQVDSLDLARQEFIVRYYSEGREIPKQIVIDGQLEDMALIEEYLAVKRHSKVTIVMPQKGEQAALIQMATANCSQHLAERISRTGKEVAALDELAKLLALTKPPQYIEAYDISNIGSETIVAGMIVFDNGRPLKAAYRKFSITSVVGKPDDYSSMKEAITRRLERYEQHKQEKVGFGRLPDLILLDGGKGHVSTIQPVIAAMGYNIPVFGMVKDDKHRTRAISATGGEISLPPNSGAMRLVSQIQDEVHRFSINYSRSKHSKTSFATLLEQVDGIGPKRVEGLYKHFKTFKAIKAATVDELCEAEGMNRKSAEALHEFLKKENN
ncbi:MAG: excinuclease ABC subunit UvrC [Oscillospiraceae bacterium]